MRGTFFTSLRISAFNIVAVPANGVGPTFGVNPNPLVDEREPSWTDSFGYIAFAGDATRGQDWEIYTIVAPVIPNPFLPPPQARNVTNDNLDQYSPDYQPGGSERIVFSGRDAQAPGDLEIFTIPGAGGTPSQVTFNGRDDYDPVYSPDGRKIAYSGADEAAGQTDREIYTRDLTTGARVQVTNNTTDDFEPSWQPRP